MNSRLVSILIFMVIAVWQGITAIMQLKSGELKSKNSEKFNRIYTKESVDKYIRFSSIVTIIDSVIMIIAILLYHFLDLGIPGLLAILGVVIICPVVNLIYEKNRCILKNDDE